jgi:hypothetical protein
LGPFRPGHNPPARFLNRAYEWASRATSLVTGSPGGASTSGPAGLASFERQRPFVARITSVPGGSGSGESGSGSGLSGSGASGSGDSGSGSGEGCPTGYGFQQVKPDACGEWVDSPEGWSGDGDDLPLYGLPGASAAVGDYCIVYPGDGTWFFFAGGVSGGGGDFVELDVVTALCVLPGITAPVE